ncbi:MAG: RNA polymerase sigma factor [Gammaproteobacteria bacterium]|nr:MAG: RNA polymerase sigma factor [Gammaproteobacteria bacterium]
MKPECEQSLIERAKQGDREAFSRLTRAHYRQVYASCLAVCGQPVLAEDCTQEAFLKAWRSIRSFRGDSSLLHWLRRIAHNVMVSHFRRAKSWVSIESVDFRLGTDDSIASTEQRLDIKRAIAALPEKAKRVFQLYAQYGYAHQEIARLEGIAEGTSKAQYHRARQILMEALS